MFSTIERIVREWREARYKTVTEHAFPHDRYVMLRDELDRYFEEERKGKEECSGRVEDT